VRVLMVGSVSNRLHQGPVQWAGHHFEAVGHYFDRVVDFNLDRPCEKAKVDRAELDAFLELAKGFDAVFCESPEALILAQEWKTRKIPPTPLLALEVHGLVRVLAMREWYLATEGRDPWPYVSTAPWIAWLAASSVQSERLVQAGVPPERIHWVRGSTGAYSMLLPEAEALFDGGPEADGPAADGLPEDAVVVPGSGRRDPECYLQAARDLPEIPFAVVDQHNRDHHRRLAGSGLTELPNVRWLETLALESYIALLRRARLVVVALQAGTADGGHTTVCMAHRLKTPVICSDVPGIADYVEADINAHLVAPGDPLDLAEAIRTLFDDRETNRRLVENGYRTELSRARESQENFKRALTSATKALGRTDL
jgi:hypothetical protein